jgi:hypothetical protein
MTRAPQRAAWSTHFKISSWQWLVLQPHPCPLVAASHLPGTSIIFALALFAMNCCAGYGIILSSRAWRYQLGFDLRNRDETLFSKTDSGVS